MDHEGEPVDTIKFGMKAVKFHPSAYSRQIHEAVTIQINRQGHVILNSKAEYNRCALPQLTIKMGEKTVKEMETDLKAELKKEKLLEDMIKEMKRKKKKE